MPENLVAYTLLIRVHPGKMGGVYTLIIRVYPTLQLELINFAHPFNFITLHLHAQMPLIALLGDLLHLPVFLLARLSAFRTSGLIFN